MTIAHPHTINLKDCELIYGEKGIKQIERLKQIQPESIAPGTLTHSVAEIFGNHTKAVGAKIRFTYKELEEKEDLVYEVKISWV